MICFLFSTSVSSRSEAIFMFVFKPIQFLLHHFCDYGFGHHLSWLIFKTVKQFVLMFFVMLPVRILLYLRFNYILSTFAFLFKYNLPTFFVSISDCRLVFRINDSLLLILSRQLNIRKQLLLLFFGFVLLFFFFFIHSNGFKKLLAFVL